MLPQTTPHDSLGLSCDRRRVPRYSCGGMAQISSLPLYGSLLTVKVRDLGLGGCCIECAENIPLLDLGTRAEIVVNVNSWFFRARAHVKSIRGLSGISMEFTRMSAGASSMLADLIADLHRSRQPLSWNSGNRQSSNMPRQRDSVAIEGTVMPHDTEEAFGISHSQRGVCRLRPAANLLDIFV
jgi:hypothetical protein